MVALLPHNDAVKIDNYNGRLPDILFVRADNAGIIHADAVYGVPDLVIEIVSPGDRPSTLIPLESDYRSLGIGEIVFIDPQRLRVRELTKIDDAYRETTLATGSLELVSIPGFRIEVEWLFAAAKPTEFTIIRQLIEATETAAPSLAIRVNRKASSQATSAVSCLRLSPDSGLTGVISVRLDTANWCFERAARSTRAKRLLFPPVRWQKTLRKAELPLQFARITSVR